MHPEPADHLDLSGVRVHVGGGPGTTDYVATFALGVAGNNVNLQLTVRATGFDDAAGRATRSLVERMRALLDTLEAAADPPPRAG